MANEGVIKVQFPIAGLGTVTAKILKPDDTVRDAQTAVALDDTGHPNIYTNPGAITIVEGDSKVAYVGAVNVGGETHRQALVDLNSYDPPTDTEMLAAHATTDALVNLIKDIAEADTVIDISNSAQWVLIFNKKGTSTEIMRKNMKDINGAAVTATTAVVGANEHTT